VPGVVPRAALLLRRQRVQVLVGVAQVVAVGGGLLVAGGRCLGRRPPPRRLLLGRPGLLRLVVVAALAPGPARLPVLLGGLQRQAGGPVHFQVAQVLVYSHAVLHVVRHVVYPLRRLLLAARPLLHLVPRLLQVLQVRVHLRQRHAPR
jgi:hypothetical protein